MIRNYIKIAWRNIVRFKLFSIINIAGLSVALASSIILFLYIEHELSFDKFHEKKDRLYRIVYIKEHPSNTIYGGYSPYPLAGFIRQHLPAYSSTCLMNYQSLDLKLGDRAYNEKNVLFVDSVFFDLFDFHWKHGNPATSLKDLRSVVLTESIANKYFADENAMGELINLPGHGDLKISGIIEDPPLRNSQPFCMIAPLDLFTEKIVNQNVNQWGYTMSGLENWILLPKNTNPKEVERKLKELMDEHLDGDYSPYLRFGLQPLDDVHLQPEFQNNAGTYTTSRNNILMVAVIGILILIIGSINFVNLSNAKGLRRMKEVGVRKVLGAHRSLIQRQFLVETYLTVFISIVFAVVLVEVFISSVNDFFGNLLELSVYQSQNFLVFILIIFLLIGLMSGLYPAVFLSRFKAIDTLKNSFRGPGKFSSWTRNILLLFQFVISVGLLVSVIVINRQINFIQKKELGFKQENIVSFAIPDPDNENIERVSSLLVANPSVGSFSFGLGAPTSNNNMGSNFSSPQMEIDDDLMVNLKLVDTAYLNTFGLELLAGEWLYKKPQADSLYKLVVNEELLKYLGISNPSEAIGLRLQVSGIPGHIVGVVRNFHTASLKRKQEAVAFVFAPRFFYNVMVHIERNFQESIQRINQDLGAVFPDYVIDYYTIKDNILEMYEREQSTLTLLKFFSFIALMIAFLGLFGLVSFYMVQKTKEIGIRKVLGASEAGLIMLLTKWQVYIIFVASLIGGSISWYFTDQWLGNFVYRIDYPFWVFPAVFLMLVFLNFLTIFFHVYKTARAKPVDAIKYE